LFQNKVNSKPIENKLQKTMQQKLAKALREPKVNRRKTTQNLQLRLLEENTHKNSLRSSNFVNFYSKIVCCYATIMQKGLKSDCHRVKYLVKK